MMKGQIQGKRISGFQMHEGVEKQPGVRISSKDVALTYAKTRLRSNSEFYRKSHNVGVQ